MSTAAPEVYLRALIEELPRLIREAPDWADTLIAQEVELAPMRLTSVAAAVHYHLRDTLLNFIRTPAFVGQTSNAQMVVDALTNLGAGTEQ